VSDLLDGIVVKTSLGRTMIIEEQVQLCLKPKPKWCPDSLWRWLLHELLYLEKGRMNSRELLNEKE